MRGLANGLAVRLVISIAALFLVGAATCKTYPGRASAGPNTVLLVTIDRDEAGTTGGVRLANLGINVVRAPAGISGSGNRLVAPNQLPARLAAGAIASNPTAQPFYAAACLNTQRLGMVDTPVDRTHRALRGARIVQRSFSNRTSKGRGPDHGTAIAALLVGSGPDHPPSLAPGAELYAAAALQERPNGTLTLDLLAFMEALDWMIANEVSVVNMSFETQENPVLSMVLERAADKGLVLMAAAGNGGPRADPAFPAAHPDVIAVTAVDPRRHIYRYANHGAYVDFAALGVSLVTATARGTERRSGTSLAVPFVTIAAARLLEAGVPPRHETVRAALAASAVDLGRPGRDDIFGWGFIEAPNCAR